MAHQSLLDVFDDLSGIRGTFLAYDDGLRTWQYTYAEVTHAARVFAARLDAAGIRKGEAVLLWSENRPEWVVALWGCLLRGIVAVPLDVNSRPPFVLRVRDLVKARLCVAGETVGTELLAASLELWPARGLLDRAALATPPPALAAVEVGRDDVAEILFTSGATAAPKGVVITHRNILANLEPIEREVTKYRRWARPLLPLRFLNLLPLSHLFGQALATFVPPMLDGTVLFVHGFTPQEVVRQVKAHRVSVVVCVPKMLDVLHDYLQGRFPEARHDPGPMHWAKRWWRYRRVHNAFGWKFWAFVVGAAPLAPALEASIRRLAFVVVQGYGLTEAAPIVTFNHPFRTRPGSVGVPVSGVEVRIAEDGEIVVRGENVTRGYVGEAGEAGAALQDGWLRTGDIGYFDEAGRLYVRGRKKEMIVTPEGLNVFPDDVERVLLEEPGVVDAAVVGLTRNGEERVHAVLVLEPGADGATVATAANGRLLEHQRVRGTSVWPAAELPRTPVTRKLRRAEIRAWLESEPGARGAEVAGPAATVAGVVSRVAGGREAAADTSIEALGLSSLERVELLMALESQFGTAIDERAYAEARTIAEVERLVAASGAEPLKGAPAGLADGGDRPFVFPAWNRAWWARAVRRVNLPLWVLPCCRVLAWIDVRGVQHLHDLEGPVVFAANHQSHLDTPAVFRALPPRWRYRLAVAMAKEFFRGYFFPEGRWWARWPRWAFTGTLYYLAALFFNAFPLPQREAGARYTLRYIGSLATEGYSILIFPEGRRTEAGEMREFRPGVALIGARLGLPVVPVRLDGFERILHHSWWVPRPGRARVTFGPPLRLDGHDYPRLAADVHRAVAALADLRR